MPYRRLPKTDAARLKALRAVTENNVVYTVEGRFLNSEDLAQARKLYQELETASDQYSICMRTQVRYSKRISTLQHNVMMYLSHFLQVLFLAIERGEIEKEKLSLYGLEEMMVPYLKTPDAIMKWAPKIIEGEKNRLMIPTRRLALVKPVRLQFFSAIFDPLQILVKRTEPMYWLLF